MRDTETFSLIYLFHMKNTCLLCVRFGGLHAIVKEILSKRIFQARLQNCEERLFVSSCLACRSVRPHGTTRLQLAEFS